LRYSEIGKIMNVDGLQPIVARAEDPEYGEVTKNPGNVVDENILASEQDCWTEYRVRKPRLLEFTLENCLAAEILKRGLFGWIGNADVDHARDACAMRCGEQFASVFDRLRMAKISVIEAYPVGIVENGRALKRAFEFVRVFEVERVDLDSISEGVRAVRGVCKSTHAMASAKQSVGDVAPGVSKGARYNVQLAFAVCRQAAFLPNGRAVQLRPT
jgi:hypothetical protein